MLFWHRFLVDLGSIFPPNLPPQTLQNPRKIDAKSASILDFKFRSIFDRFWLPTWTPRISFGVSGLAPNGIFRIFRKPHVGCDFDANLAPFSSPKSTKIHQKIDPKMHQILARFFDRFFIDVGSILEVNLEPCWQPLPPKSRAKRASTPAQSDQDRQEPQKTSKMNPKSRWGIPPGLVFCSWDHFGEDFGAFLDLDFGRAFRLIRVSAMAG